MNERSPNVAAPALQVRAIVQQLAAASVRYVLVGSLAAAAWAGAAPAAPGDFDLAPQLTEENLRRLAQLLWRWEARPVHRPDWRRTLSPEDCAAWRPEPPSADQLDHQLVTPLGLVDVVPRIAGPYDELMLRAAPVLAWGIPMSVAHPTDLLGTLRVDREPKHQLRRSVLLECETRARQGASPIGLEFLNREDS